MINGAATFTITLKTAGSQTITATDTANSSLTGTSGVVNVTAAAASQFVVSAPASATAGTAFTFTVTAEDPYNNPATSYSGSIHFSSSDAAAVLPGNKTLTGGVGTFTATLNTVGNQTLTVTDTTNGSLTGSATVNVTGAAGPVLPATQGVPGFAFAPMATADAEEGGNGGVGEGEITAASASPFLPLSLSPALSSALPSVIMQTPPTTVYGNVMISYSLINANRDACSVQVQFSPDGGITWQNATAAPGGDGTENLPSGLGPTGFAHEYMWASGLDIGNVYNSDVEIRITPVDSVTGEAGAAASTARFSVDNTQLPDLVISGAPATATAGTSFNFVVTLKNQSGTIISSSDPLQFYSSDPSAVLPGAPSGSASLAGGVGSFSATLNTPGAQWIAVDDSTSGAAAKVNINTLAAATQLGFTTSPQTFTAGTASGTITIALENTSGNPVNAVNPVTVNLSSTSAAGTFNVQGPGAPAIWTLGPSSVTIPAGGSTVSFQYSDTAAGMPTLTAAAGAPSGSLASATQQETVVAAAATHVVFSTAPQTLTAGIASGAITVALEDAYGNPALATSNLPVGLATTSGKGMFTPLSPLTIAAETSTASFQYTDTAAGTPTLTITAGSFAAINQQETVNPAAASQLAFTAGPQTLTAGVASGTITAALEDAFGNPIEASNAITVNLATTSSKGTFTPPSPLTIAAGAGSVSFQYEDTAVGTPTLTVAASGLASATQPETVNPAAASQLSFTTAPQTLTAGVASGTITVALEDAFGNPVAASSAFDRDPKHVVGQGHVQSRVAADHRRGGQHRQLRVQGHVVGNADTHRGGWQPSIGHAAGDGQPGRGQPTGVYDRAADPDGGDRGGNDGLSRWRTPSETRSAQAGPLTVTLGTTSGKGTFIPASPLTIPAGASTVSFQYKDTAAGTPTITTAAGGFSSATRAKPCWPRQPPNWSSPPRSKS